MEDIERVESTYDKWFLEPFPHYRIPQALFKSPFSTMSAEAKLVYGVLLSRIALSHRNAWILDGELYSFFKLSEIEEFVGCGHDKATRILRELENYQLLSRKRRYLGKPAYIFLRDFRQNAKKSPISER